jgi:D-3-phosphoglycerate dehydrogenase / 2-oxoglutarate reductase
MSGALVAITDSDLPSNHIEEELLEGAGLRALRADCTTGDEVIERCKGAEALIVQWVPIGERVLDALPTVRFISRLGIGYDMIDVEAASRHGVAVANTPDYCIEEVVAHTLALILDRVRGITPHDRSMRQGAWAPIAAFPAAGRPSALTLAVIGYGRIGSRVAAAAAAIGFDVVVHDPVVPAERIAGDGLRAVNLDEALAESHVVTLHAPLTEATRHLIDAERLATMREGAVLVNTCRGGLVDEDALVEALRSGRLGGAALDVFEREPLDPDSRLRGLPQVTLSSHSAWYSPASLHDLPVYATRQVIEFLRGEPVDSIVNGDRTATG